jgi:dihydrolipoamide dehydrogenase
MGDPFDIVVVGAGTGGYSTALRAAELGKRVAMVEQGERLGGTCLLRGCIPTKALLQSAAVMDTVERASEWGIKAAGEPDWSAIVAFEDSMVDKNVKGLTGLVKLRGIEVVSGSARIRSGQAVEVDDRTLETAAVVIAGGPVRRCSRARDHAPNHHQRPGAVVRPHPDSAVVIGAGAVGGVSRPLYRSFGGGHLRRGSPRLAPLEDDESQRDRPRVPQAWHHRGRRRGREGSHGYR